MIRIKDLPDGEIYFPRPSDFSKLQFNRELQSKGYAEDTSSVVQYDLAKTTIKYLSKLFIRALHLGTQVGIDDYMSYVPPDCYKFIHDIRNFIESLWYNCTYYQKALLYMHIVNEYNLHTMAIVTRTSPSNLKTQFLKIAENMNWDTRYDRLHELILSIHMHTPGAKASSEDE